SSVVERLLEDGSFTPREITRNPDSDASLKPKERGTGGVKADSGDKASLVKALPGSEAAFGYINLFSPIWRTGVPNEITQGKNVINAAREVGVKFFVLSSLPSLKKLSGGKYSKFAPYDEKDKGVIEEYSKASGLDNASLLGGFAEGLWTRAGITTSQYKLNWTSLI
ncbi:NmrA-like domain-containing protein, partial [Mycena capillaripes]